MSTVKLIKWGNSLGLRVPAAILKEADLVAGVELEVAVNKNGVLMLTPQKNLQAAWLEQFNAIADAGQEENFTEISNDFDEDEWTW